MKLPSKRGLQHGAKLTQISKKYGVDNAPLTVAMPCFMPTMEGGRM